MIKVLVSVGNYLPSYKAGGAVKSVSSLIEGLDSIDFDVVTSDRDLGDERAFEDVILNAWQSVGRANVFYISFGYLSFCRFLKSIKGRNYDVIYLNSFFNFRFTIIFLLLNMFGFFGQSKILLAPRGEFSLGALALKGFKKRAYISLAKKLHLYKGVFWQASSQFELSDIKRALDIDESHVLVASDVPIIQGHPLLPTSFEFRPFLSLVFISRISPIKNLYFAISMLGKIKYNVCFDIYGPIEDVKYWDSCLDLISTLPDNIQVRYCGSLSSVEVGSTFASYDLFLFPTLGENYGHVIAESLSAGTPVLISNETPWVDLEKHGLGWNIPLSDVDGFIEVLNIMAGMNPDQLYHMKSTVAKNAELLINAKSHIADNLNMFKFVAGVSDVK